MLCIALAKAQTGSPAPLPRGRHRLVFRATDFHFHHHVFCDDSATKKATGTATEIDWQSEERRAGDHECRFKPNENWASKKLEFIADKVCLIRLSPRRGVGADWRIEAFEGHFADILE